MGLQFLRARQGIRRDALPVRPKRPLLTGLLPTRLLRVFLSLDPPLVGSVLGELIGALEPKVDFVGNLARSLLLGLDFQIEQLGWFASDVS